MNNKYQSWFKLYRFQTFRSVCPTTLIPPQSRPRWYLPMP